MPLLAAGLDTTGGVLVRDWVFMVGALGGFDDVVVVIQQNGLGSDMLPLGWRVCKVLKVVENNVSVYTIGATDNIATYTMSANMQALLLYSDEEVNEHEGGPVISSANSDSYDNPNYRAVAFPNGYDYTVQVETGWPAVPGDIQEVTKIIMEDLACDAPNYIQKYVREYETKDFRADFQRSAFAGTGNLVVDQILQKYWGQSLYHNVRVI